MRGFQQTLRFVVASDRSRSSMTLAGPLKPKSQMRLDIISQRRTSPVDSQSGAMYSDNNKLGARATCGIKFQIPHRHSSQVSSHRIITEMRYSIIYAFETGAGRRVEYNTKIVKITVACTKEEGKGKRKVRTNERILTPYKKHIQSEGERRRRIYSL